MQIHCIKIWVTNYLFDFSADEYDGDPGNYDCSLSTSSGKSSPSLASASSDEEQQEVEQVPKSDLPSSINHMSHSNPNYYAMCMLTKLTAGSNGCLPFHDFVPFSKPRNGSMNSFETKVVGAHVATDESKLCSMEESELLVNSNLPRDSHQELNQNKSRAVSPERDYTKIDADNSYNSDVKDTSLITSPTKKHCSEKEVQKQSLKGSSIYLTSPSNIPRENESTEEIVDQSPNSLNHTAQVSYFDYQKNVPPSESSDKLSELSQRRATELERGR